MCWGGGEGAKGIAELMNEEFSVNFVAITRTHFRAFSVQKKFTPTEGPHFFF